MSFIPLVIASCSPVMRQGIHLILGKLTASIKIEAVKNYDELMKVMSVGKTGMLITDGSLPYLYEKGRKPAVQTRKPWLKVAIYCTEKAGKNEDYYYLSSKLVYLESASGIEALRDTITTMLLQLTCPLSAPSCPEWI